MERIVKASRVDTAGKTVSELYRLLTPLMEEIDALEKILVDNPYCIIAGVYDRREQDGG